MILSAHPNTIGQRLIYLREQYEKTTGQKINSSYVAKNVLDVEPYVLWRYEHDKFKKTTTIPKDHLTKLAAFYDSTEDYILYGDTSDDNKIPTIEEILMNYQMTFGGKLLTDEEKKVFLQFGGNAIQLKRGE